ncbi:sugar phosphate isomerase/epimerase family protein [Enterococcus avium]
MVKMINRFAPMNLTYQKFQLQTFLNDVSEVGFTKIDLWTCPTHFYVDTFSHSDTDQLKRQLQQKKLSISCISPRQSCPNPFHLAAKDKDMIRRTKNYFQQVVYSAHELEAPRIMITSGWSFNDETREEAWKRSVSLCKWLCRFAESYGVKVAIEPLTPQSTKLVNSIEEMKKYIADVDERNLKIIVDTGTIRREKESLSQYFQVFGEIIDYCHLTNYKKEQFAHVDWTNGERHLASTLKEIEQNHYQGDFCLEYTHRDYFDNPREIYETTYNQILKMEENK